MKKLFILLLAALLVLPSCTSIEQPETDNGTSSGTQMSTNGESTSADDPPSDDYTADGVEKLCIDAAMKLEKNIKSETLSYDYRQVIKISGAKDKEHTLNTEVSQSYFDKLDIKVKNIDGGRDVIYRSNSSENAIYDNTNDENIKTEYSVERIEEILNEYSDICFFDPALCENISLKDVQRYRYRYTYNIPKENINHFAARALKVIDSSLSVNDVTVGNIVRLSAETDIAVSAANGGETSDVYFRSFNNKASFTLNINGEEYTVHYESSTVRLKPDTQLSGSINDGKAYTPTDDEKAFVALAAEFENDHKSKSYTENITQSIKISGARSADHNMSAHIDRSYLFHERPEIYLTATVNGQERYYQSSLDVLFFKEGEYSERKAYSVELAESIFARYYEPCFFSLEDCKNISLVEFNDYGYVFAYTLSNNDIDYFIERSLDALGIEASVSDVTVGNIKTLNGISEVTIDREKDGDGIKGAIFTGTEYTAEFTFSINGEEYTVNYKSETIKKG